MKLVFPSWLPDPTELLKPVEQDDLEVGWLTPLRRNSGDELTSV
jgi:hypothetical protein